MLKNKKGFTLFTALVGFIIIGIGVLVMQHMSNSEQNYQNLLNALLTQQEMDSSINIIKLDAISSFDLIYRNKFWKYYTTNSDKAIYMVDTDTWEEYQQQFILETFGVDYDLENVPQTNKAAGFVANKVIGILTQYRGNYKGNTYFFRVYDYEFQENKPIDLSPESDQPTSLSPRNLSTAINESLNNNYFLNILDCEKDNCPRGSFYTNFDLVSIPYNIYIYLPRILITNTLDNTMIDDSILPYSKLSLYLPIRLFGVLNLVFNRIKSIPEENFINIEYGNVYDYTSCESITSYSEIEKLSKEKIEFRDVFGESYNYAQNLNGFNLSVSDIAPNREYLSEAYFIELYNKKLLTLTKKKVSSVNITMDIIDNDVFENFGRSPMNYKFMGTKVLNQNETPKIHFCFCEGGSGQDNEVLKCSPHQNNSKFLTKIDEVIGGLGNLSQKEKDDLKNQILAGNTN